MNKCTAEKPCEVNAGDCTFDDECRGNLICTKNNCEGSTLSLNAKCCQEPGGDIFYIIVWFGNGGCFYLFVPIICFSRDSIRNGSHFESKPCIYSQENSFFELFITDSTTISIFFLRKIHFLNPYFLWQITVEIFFLSFIRTTNKGQ